MIKVSSNDQLRLVGFNNLTKALSFNLYDFCTARTYAERESYIEYINDKYNAAKITHVLKGVCDIIEAKVLGISDQDYDPWGASSLVLMSDIKGEVSTSQMLSTLSGAAKVKSSSTAMHLDKSHICAHTYPDFLHNGSICSVRVDIDIATCGEISPLNALNYLFDQFESDVAVIDYVVRGFTRDENGKRVYIDHPLQSIQDYIRADILEDYYCLDLSLQRDLIWQTKMLRTKIDEQDYFLGDVDLEDAEVQRRLDDVKREMRGVLHMFPEN